MLHLSLFLFFAGLLVYLFNINHTAFNVTAWWNGLSATVYMGITTTPNFRHLYTSGVVKGPQRALVANLGMAKILYALTGLLDRTPASNLCSESAKQRQLIIGV